MKSNNIIESFNHAVTGVIIAIKTERNLRFHFVIAFLIVALSLFLNFTRIEFLILFFSISLVIITEMLNTAIEKSIDIFTQEYHTLAKIAKDISAGAVLISSINSIIVGYLLFFDRLNPFANQVIFKIKNSSIHLSFIAIILVILLTIGLKAKFYRGRGSHFQGGTVSGHSSVSFCIATIISFLGNNILIATLSYGLALLVAESRVEGKIHSIFEVVVGAILGILVGIIIFQIIG